MGVIDERVRLGTVRTDRTERRKAAEGCHMICDVHVHGTVHIHDLCLIDAQ